MDCDFLSASESLAHSDGSDAWEWSDCSCGVPPSVVCFGCCLLAPLLLLLFALRALACCRGLRVSARGRGRFCCSGGFGSGFRPGAGLGFFGGGRPPPSFSSPACRFSRPSFFLFCGVTSLGVVVGGAVMTSTFFPSLFGGCAGVRLFFPPTPGLPGGLLPSFSLFGCYYGGYRYDK